MFTLKGRQDLFKLTLPDNFIAEEINDKYAKIIQANKSYTYKPIDFLNETIQSVQVLGFNEGSVQQMQQGTGKPIIKDWRVEQNRFPHTAFEYNYRAEKNPLALLDHTLNIYFTLRFKARYFNILIIFFKYFFISVYNTIIRISFYFI